MKKASLALTSLVLTLSLALYTDSVAPNHSQAKASQEVKVTVQQVSLKVKRSLRLLYHELFG
jgi:hypothetical protein